MATKWVTHRYAVQVLNLTHTAIKALPTMQVHAPNGIIWQVYEVLED